MSRLPAQNHCITFPLNSASTTTKVLVVHSLSPTAEKGKDHDFGVSDDSGDAALYELPLPRSFFTKVNSSP